MPNIKIRRYAAPLATGWSGYMEPHHRRWIAFLYGDERPPLVMRRDVATGAVLLPS